VAVHRSTHAVTLTEEGRELVPAAQQPVDSANALQEQLGRRRSKAVGRVRLPLGLYFSSKLSALLDKHEELSIDLILTGFAISSKRGSIFRSVSAGQRFRAIWIGAIAAFLVATSQYLNRRAAAEQPADLQSHDCIVYHRWGRDDVWWFASPEEVVSVSVRGRFRANNSDAVRRAALNGHGIALMSHLLSPTISARAVCAS
jgi:DNA-binding transcriptional LysR family regulator